MGLRTARRGAEEQRQAPVVAVHGAGARRHRRPRLLGDPGPRGLGGQRPRRHLHRPADRVPVLPQALPGRPPDRGVRGQARPRAAGRPGRHRVPELRQPGHVHRAQELQRDAPHPPRPGRGRVRPGLPAAGDRAGDLRQLQERADDLAAEGAVRHRPGRQVVPQRDHARELHLPHPRVRADGDGVLRQAGHRRGMARALDRRAPRLVDRARREPRQPPAVRAPEGEAEPLRQADGRHRVPVRLRRLGVGRARGHRQPDRLRPDPHQEHSGQDLTYLEQESGERYIPT